MGAVSDWKKLKALLSSLLDPVSWQSRYVTATLLGAFGTSVNWPFDPFSGAVEGFDG